MTIAAWICLLLPLGAAVAITLLGKAIPRRVAGWIATLATFGAFGAAVVSFVAMQGRDPERRTAVTTSWDWLSAGSFHAGFSLLVDPLSVMMMLIVTGVGGLIVLYSVGYMDGENEERRYFAYMALFVFSMLLLVEGGNLLLLLAGWGMVGLSSYLLIGFHQDRPSAIAAAKKAFVMNAIGDATMALALFLLTQHTGTLDYASTFERMQGLSSNHWLVNLVALGLLGGAVAKSAQLPLHTWLPDAMEGPTPVSALIHAATMVTAGVYLIVRCHPLFELAPHVQDLAAGIGAATLVFAGLIALVQTDIKRVIAYSTMSQIGYMFLGAGLGAYANGMFHLMTHAFFKALLFLAAGVLIHALAGEQDIRKMGGLRALMPRTYWLFLAGALALVGVPPFAGFFSKDSIIAATLDRGTFGYVLFAAAMIGAFLTGLYTFRLVYLVFGGPPSPFVREHLHKEHGEGPLSMVSVITVLAILSVIGGWIQFAGVWTPITDWLDPVARPLADVSGTKELVASVLAVGLGLAGVALAGVIYGRGRRRVPRVAPALQRLLEHKFYFDEAYDLVFYEPAAWIAEAWRRYVEGPIVGGGVNAVAEGTRLAGGEASRVQTGFLRAYALAIGASIAVLAVVFLAVR
ncbi:MAG: NADH-quinone oxidoreductase subunit [Gaiellaceae bacterium]|nr:NADH-quinone oxidoreductase subunit [Gaiellaceae bacterium]